MQQMIAMLIASQDTQAALRAYAVRSGFDIDDGHDFHVTLLATANPIMAPEADNLIAPVEVMATGFDTLGPDANVPALSLDAHEALVVARAFFVDLYGAEPTYADFKPHVSLSYDWDGEPPLDGIDLPAFPLIFDRLVVTEFKPEQKAILLRRKSLRVGAHGVYR